MGGPGVRASRRVGGGRPSLVPYVTGGFPGVDASLLRGLQAAGADAIEVGIPFSDPVMDGGVIQEASRLALEAGTHPGDVLATIHEAALTIPVAVMTYVNPVFRRGIAAFLDEARDAGRGRHHRARPAGRRGRASSTPPRQSAGDRRRAAGGARDDARAARRHRGPGSHGFVYCVATYGVTGARTSLSGHRGGAWSRPCGRSPTCRCSWASGSPPRQAHEACAFADGVIVGSALMARMLDGDREGLLRLAQEFRAGRRSVEAPRRLSSQCQPVPRRSVCRNGHVDVA